MDIRYTSGNITALSIDGTPYRCSNVACTEGWIAWEPVKPLVLDRDSPLGKVWDNPEDDRAFDGE